MRRTVLTAAGALFAAAIAVLVAVPANAAGSDVLTTGSVGGPNVAVGDVVTSGLKSGTVATFSNSAGSVTCSVSAFTGTIQTNPAAGGTATESLTAQTFSTCTSHITGVTAVNSITVNDLPYNASISGSGKTISLAGGSAGAIQATVSLRSILGNVTCVYKANNNAISGTTSNTDNSLTFSGAGFTKSSGSGLCPSTTTLSATYAPAVDTSVSGSPAVFVQ